MNNKIPFMDLKGQYKEISREIEDAVKEVLRSGKYIQGPQVAQFEKDYAKYCNAKYCVGVSSGTEALTLALRVLGIGMGDEVITVPNTFTATAEAIIFVGATPIFVDVDSRTFNMDPKLLEKSITKKTKAVIPVHLHGNPVDLDKILKITKSKKIPVIEDAAQAHGAKYKGKIIGSLESDFTCFSFYPTKNLGAVGDAGAIVTNNLKYRNRLRALINHGRSGHHNHLLVGTTARLDTIQAIVLSKKLKLLNKWNSERRFWAKYYKDRLPKNIQFEEETIESLSVYHIFGVQVEDRDNLSVFLNKWGIETGMHYPQVLHLQLAYKFLGYKKGDFKVSERFAKLTLSLPLFPHIKESQVNYIITKVKEFYNK